MFSGREWTTVTRVYVSFSLKHKHTSGCSEHKLKNWSQTPSEKARNARRPLAQKHTSRTPRLKSSEQPQQNRHSCQWRWPELTICSWEWAATELGRWHLYCSLKSHCQLGTGNPLWLPATKLCCNKKAGHLKLSINRALIREIRLRQAEIRPPPTPPQGVVDVRSLQTGLFTYLSTNLTVLHWSISVDSEETSKRTETFWPAMKVAKRFTCCAGRIQATTAMPAGGWHARTRGYSW